MRKDAYRSVLYESIFLLNVFPLKEQDKTEKSAILPVEFLLNSFLKINHSLLLALEDNKLKNLFAKTLKSLSLTLTLLSTTAFAQEKLYVYNWTDYVPSSLVA